MKKILFAMVVVLVSVLFSGCSSQQKETPVDVVSAWVHACLRQDENAADNYCVASRSTVLNTKEFVNMVKEVSSSGEEGIKALKIAIDNMKIDAPRMNGNKAIVSCKLLSSVLRFQLVKENDKWLIEDIRN